VRPRHTTMWTAVVPAGGAHGLKQGRVSDTQRALAQDVQWCTYMYVCSGCGCCDTIGKASVINVQHLLLLKGNSQLRLEDCLAGLLAAHSVVCAHSVRCHQAAPCCVQLTV
jgi:hypothetical protein